MEKEQFTALREQLGRHEGRKNKPYTDTVGKLTIGVGRNLSDRGLRGDEIDYLLANDIAEAEAIVRHALGETYATLNPARQNALIDMAFNLGETRFLGFKQMLTAVRDGNFERAANEMLASKWAKQVGTRAIELSQQMRKGQ